MYYTDGSFLEKGIFAPACEASSTEEHLAHHVYLN